VIGVHPSNNSLKASIYPLLSSVAQQLAMFQYGSYGTGYQYGGYGQGARVGMAGVAPGAGYVGGVGGAPGVNYVGGVGGAPGVSYSVGAAPGVSYGVGGAPGVGYSNGGAACCGAPNTGACGTGACGAGVPGAGGCAEPGSAECGCGPGGGCGSGTGCGTGCGTGPPMGTAMSFAGGGNGDYVQETSYRYVGMGAGSHTPTPIFGPRTNCCCLLPLLLLPLLLIPLLYYLLTSSPTVVVTVAPTGPPGTCTIWGDPHVLTFDNKHVDFYSPGEYWLVKSSTMSIQARYLPTPVTHGLAVTKEIAVGGAFMNDDSGKPHILRINARTATYDGTPILTGFPSTWQAPAGGPSVRAQFNDQGGFLQNGRQGKALHVVHVQLPLGVSLQINRWTEAGEGDYINVKITMSHLPDQDGHCGNFNGNPEDDARLEIRKRVGTTGVDPKDLLFHTKTPVQTAGRPDINNCPPEKLQMAHESCKKHEKKFIPSMQCLIDVCFGGKQFAAQG